MPEFMTDGRMNDVYAVVKIDNAGTSEQKIEFIGVAIDHLHAYALMGVDAERGGSCFSPYSIIKTPLVGWAEMKALEDA